MSEQGIEPWSPTFWATVPITGPSFLRQDWTLWVQLDSLLEWEVLQSPTSPFLLGEIVETEIFSTSSFYGTGCPVHFIRAYCCFPFGSSEQVFSILLGITWKRSLYLLPHLVQLPAFVPLHSLPSERERRPWLATQHWRKQKLKPWSMLL